MKHFRKNEQQNIHDEFQLEKQNQIRIFDKKTNTFQAKLNGGAPLKEKSRL